MLTIGLLIFSLIVWSFIYIQHRRSKRLALENAKLEEENQDFLSSIAGQYGIALGFLMDYGGMRMRGITQEKIFNRLKGKLSQKEEEKQLLKILHDCELYYKNLVKEQEIKLAGEIDEHWREILGGQCDVKTGLNEIVGVLKLLKKGYK